MFRLACVACVVLHGPPFDGVGVASVAAATENYSGKGVQK